MKLAITICATQNFCEAMLTQARRVAKQSNLPTEGNIILAGDDSKELKEVVKLYTSLLPTWQVTHLKVVDGDKGKDYKVPAQLLIARLREAAFTEAIRWGATHCFSLDSDVLPPPNCLETLLWALAMPNDIYQVAFAPYPSQGGGLHLGGFGTPQHQINPDFLEDERKLTEDLTAERATLSEMEEVAKKLKGVAQEQAYANIRCHIDLSDYKKRLEQCPPKGNVFELNSKQWRRRGWFEMVYPALGRGALVPVDWVGFGATLMGAKALHLCSFDGYQGQGTEDLFIGWHRWHPAGIKIAAVPHVSCDHIIRKDGKFMHCHSYAETEGEYRDHLRSKITPWVNLDKGAIP